MKDFFVYYKIPLWIVILFFMAFQLWNFYVQNKLFKNNESLKNELAEQQVLLKEQVENRQYTSQKRFDLELDIYKEMFDSLINAYDDFSVLMPMLDIGFLDEESKKKVMLERRKHFVESFDRFSKVRRSFAPFYDKKTRMTLEEISKYMMDQDRYFQYTYMMPEMKTFAQQHLSEIHQNNLNVRMLVDKVTMQVSVHLKSEI
ncbi:hypothetical protein LFAB_08855 [Lactiplantibacillus fabifermentans T30PCM01]|uniref:Uncharacterized protein n=1 Tax=Lactiplantibacillus fabifermentans T30PCM01 TaxID=1400520 RepID=W6T7B0_9LACO|nr:hypothetical protein [Lactiplantibacillus fabifermentans]ETY74137.1 hypothetical protein LFAB_08855 [Lactiplantibacillus fabifermentans T30PCM01]